MSVEKLEVYKKINELVVEVYKLTGKYPKQEIYGLTSQMRRAAISIGSNLMEGNYRGSIKDFLRFIDISKGSSAELKYQLFISQELKFLSEGKCKQLINEVEIIIKMLSGLQKSLREKKISGVCDE
ncbi:four helix bundle protein [bacterium]|nr:four helix bundle protein [bacterium]